MPSANSDTDSPQDIDNKDRSLSETPETKVKVEKTVVFKEVDSKEPACGPAGGGRSSSESSYDSEYHSFSAQRYTSDLSSDEDEGSRETRRYRRDLEGSADSSYLVIIDDHYSVVTAPDRPTHSSIQKNRHTRSRAQYRRQVSYPTYRSRSLSFGREGVRSLVPRVTPRLRVSRARLDNVITPVDDEEEEEKEEWQYVPFSFCSLPRRDKFILFSLGSIDLTLYMCLSILAPFYPSEAASRGVSGTVAGWVFGCFALTQFFFSPVFGYLLPKVGSRFMVLSGHFIAGACTVLFGFLDYMPYDERGVLFVSFCFLVRILMAVGCTASATGSFSIMVKTFPDNVATVFGLLETFCGVGLMVGPAVGGVLYEAGGFALPFVTVGAVMLLSVPVNMYILPSQDEDFESVLDSGSLGQVLCIPAVMVVSVATVIGGLIWAILDPTLEPHFAVYSLSPSMIGLIFLLMSAFYAMSSPFWGWIADRVVDSTPLMVLGFLFSGVGLMLLGPSPLLGLPPDYRELWLDLVALIVLGLAVSLAVVPTFEKILDSAEKAGVEDNLAMYSNVAGLWGGAYALGEFIGPSAGGFLVDTVGFDWCMTYTAAACAFIAVVLFILWVYEKKVQPTPCLISIRKPPVVKRVSPCERSPLLAGGGSEEHLAPPGGETYGSTSGDLTHSLVLPRHQDGDFHPMTQSV